LGRDTWRRRCRSTLYGGSAGIVITLLEAHRHFGDDRYADAAICGARGIAAAIDDVRDCSLYSGLTGMAVALRAVDECSKTLPPARLRTVLSKSSEAGTGQPA